MSRVMAHITHMRIVQTHQRRHVKRQVKHVAGVPVPEGGYVASATSRLLSWHSETVNAWTILVNSIASVTATTWVCDTMVPDMEDQVPFVVFTLSAVVHMPFSVGYHLFSYHGDPVHRWWHLRDIRAIFGASVMLAFATSAFVLPPDVVIANLLVASWAAVHATHRYHRGISMDVHIGLIASVAVFYLWPMVWACLHDPIAFVPSVLGTAGSLAAGGALYATKWPSPVSSHNLMHGCVMAAHACELAFLWTAYQIVYQDRAIM